MSLVEIKGDLFAVPGLDALAHGVNCVGAMGAGIAVEFRRRWPSMFSHYREACRQGVLQPGGIIAWRTLGRGPWVYNLATQPRPGPCASLPAIESALAQMVGHARVSGVKRIGMPQIGCGLGGLSYADVRPLIEVAARDVDIVVVEWTGGRR